MKYDYKAVEAKWQKVWEDEKTFHVEIDHTKPKFYALVEFPYPSGAGLHVGHPRSYTALDVVSRKRRQNGYNVLYPMGWDAFGLPTENFAMKNHIHPAIVTKSNVDHFRSQLKALGFSFDWDREINTTDPEYYKWTQWIFLQLYNHGLAYKKEMNVNWCTGCKCVLANEEVVNGVCERCGSEVVHRVKSQWMLKITAYADKLIDGLDGLDYIERVATQQKNWIGRSHGAEVNFGTTAGDTLTVYTTRCDTLFGATYMVVSPEHAMVKQWLDKGIIKNVDAVKAYQAEAARKSDFERSELNKEKTGVKLEGVMGINPVNDTEIPIFISDYVLSTYGTGAIMAVPGGDQRDYDFAVKFGLPVTYTVQPLPESGDDLANYEGKAPFVSHDGIVINSAVDATRAKGDALSLNGLRVDEAIDKVNAWLEEAGVGKGTVSYRLRDWLFSRQRYWGEPFPIVYGEDGTPHLLPDDQLPINLPDVPDYSPKTFDPEDAESNPEAPLSRNEDWVKVELDLGDGKKTYYRDTNTMPNWAGSCWYYMRYLDPTDTEHMVEKSEFDYWMGPNHNETTGKSGGVDLYIGGVEHAVLHLLYSRFWHKVLFDLGFVDSAEPFHKLFNQGMIQAYAYTDDRGQYVPAAEVVEGPADANGEPTFTWNGEHANREFGKMGKSLKNIITPDDMYANYGADTFRLYEMGMGPLAESRPWNTRNVVGSMRFLQRLWRNVVDENTGEVRVTDGKLDTKALKLLNNTIADVTVEMEAMRPNTAIAKLIVLNNHLTSLNEVPRAAVEPLILMLSPIAPHICEELWNKLGHGESLAHAEWPKADERYVGQDAVTAVVQIKGKVRAKLEVSPDIDPKELEKMALEAVADRLGGKEPRKVIVKAPKIVSIVPAE